MLIKRDKYLNQLVNKKWNGRIKIVTGIRRCGKSTLLMELFRNHLLEHGVAEHCIIKIALDDDAYAAYRDPDALSVYIRSRCNDAGKKYYILIDEVQYAISAEELKNKDVPVRLYSILNGFLRLGNLDVYVTGSNSRLLSRDVSTEFRGRGDTVHIYPFSFSEFYGAHNMDKYTAYDEYSMYGGMPYLLNLSSDEEKYAYLDSLFEEIYFKDIEERYDIRLPAVLRDLTYNLCSSIGSLTNASKIARSVRSMRNTKTDSETISLYLHYLTDSFLFSRTDRYDIKGKRYFEYPAKYYCADIGLRNIRLGLRQQEPSHIMENIIFNELKTRGFTVDVGMIGTVERNSNGSRTNKELEIDFIARKGINRYYIQSALYMEDEEKRASELRSLLKTGDSFSKIIISKSYGKSWIDEYGILRIGLLDFLLDDNFVV